MNRLGVSGSTILSEPARIPELAWDGIDHIEVGELHTLQDLASVISLCRGNGLSLGFHSPLYRGGSKYDLISEIEQTPEIAWRQLEDELRLAANNDVEYVLVHFPYFHSSSVHDPIPQIEAGLERIRLLQDKYSTKVLCEPKLGFSRDLGSIGVLRGYSATQWSRFGVSMCWDMGDNLLASEAIDSYLQDFGRWRDLIDVIHIHNVKVAGEKYYWLPVHPSFEGEDDHFTLEPLLRLAGETDATLVWEHTPHFTPNQAFVLEGFEWAKGIIGTATRAFGP